MNKTIAVCLAMFVTFFVPAQILAAKPRIRTSTGSKPLASGGLHGYSKAKLSRPTNSVVLTFSNLGSVKSISYTLSYLSGTTQQGAIGSFHPSGGTAASRDLYFGTCSHGVCTPHRNIKNAVLVVQTTLTSGSLHTKKYKIRY